MQKILKNTDEVDQIILSYNESIGYDGALELEKKLKTFLKNKKKIDPSDPRGIRLRSASKDLKENQDFSDALAYIILLVGVSPSPNHAG